MESSLSANPEPPLPSESSHSLNSESSELNNSSNSSVSSSSSNGHCGPDITDYFLQIINTVIDQTSTILLKSMFEFPLLVRPQFQAAALTMFADLFRPDGDWDLKPYLSKAQTAHCPVGEKCKFTVTLCGVCIARDMPGNIFYGYMGSYFGMSPSVLLSAANIAQWLHTRTSDPETDQNAIRMGICIQLKTRDQIVTRKAIEDCLAMYKYGMDTRPMCEPCTEKYQGLLP